MKALGTISIEAPSQNDLKQAEKIMEKAIDEARMHINNGAKIKRAWTNAEDPRAMMSLMGQLKWWSLGRTQEVKHPKKSWLSKLGEELKSIYENEPSFEEKHDG